MKRLLNLTVLFSVFLIFVTEAYAEGLYTKRLRLDADQLRQVIAAEENMHADEVTPFQSQKLERPILATASVPRLGTVRIVFTRLRRFPNVSLKVVGENGSVSYEEASHPVLLQGYVRKSGERVGPAAASYSNGKLKVTLLFDGKGRPVDLYAATDSGESGYVDLKYRRLPKHMAQATACNGHTDPFSSLVDPVQVNAAGVNQLDLELEGDKELYQAFGSDSSATSADMLSTINSVDTIYQRDVNVTINVSSQTVYTDNTQPYTATDASDLLVQIKDNSTSGSQDLTHLITGKDVCGVIDGGPCNSGVAGLAYVGVVCASSTFNAGLSERVNSATLSAVLTAHEIGHNFDGSHPGSSEGNIMDATVSPTTSQSFSTRSINEINAHIAANNSCLTMVSGDVSASSKIKKKKGNVTLTASYDQDRTGCTVNFMLGNNSAFTKKTNDLGTFTVTGTSTQIRGKQRKALKKGKVYVMATLTCGSETFESSAVKIKGAKKISASDKSTKSGKWIKLKKIKQLS